MPNYPLLIDVFEGSGLLDLPKLKENNVQYVMVRLGAYSRWGGLMGNRKDDLFDQQWALLDTDPWFKKIIYIPYNPWITWQKNLSFLTENMPKNCYGVELDVENKRTFNYTSKTYGAEFGEYYKNIPSNIQKIIYTGEAFLEYLSTWPKGNYSWAQYPYSLRPSNSVYWSWNYFRELLSKYSGPYNQNKAPDRVIAWQVTGDKVILDGSSKGMDVYVWLGTQEELDKLFGSNNTEFPPIGPPEEPTPITSRYTGNVLSAVFAGLNVRESAITGMVIRKLNANQSFDGDIKINIQGDDWIHITKPLSGWISAKYTKYIENNIEVPPIENPETKIAIPGPFRIQSYADIGEPWNWSEGQLDAYPAVCHTTGGKGNVSLSGDGKSDILKRPTKGFMKSISDIMNNLQWKQTWVQNQGWHNKGDLGIVQQVEFAHNKKWITKINSDSSYEYDVYYNTDNPPNLNTEYDQYRQGIMTIDYKTGHENTGGVIESDNRLPYISIANDRTEKLRIDPKYLKPLLYLPAECQVKTDGSNLNIRKVSVNGEIIGNYKNNETIIIIEVIKVNNKVWLKTNIGWVASWLTNLDI